MKAPRGLIRGLLALLALGALAVGLSWLFGSESQVQPGAPVAVPEEAYPRPMAKPLPANPPFASAKYDPGAYDRLQQLQDDEIVTVMIWAGGSSDLLPAERSARVPGLQPLLEAMEGSSTVHYVDEALLTITVSLTKTELARIVQREDVGAVDLSENFGQPVYPGSANLSVGDMHATEAAAGIQVYPEPVSEPTVEETAPPPIDPFATPTPENLSPVPKTPPGLASAAATLHKGDIWLVESGKEPHRITQFGDIFVVFGWNYDGSRLLFGRGRFKQGEFIGDTTNLWLFEINTGYARQMTTTGLVASADWSPVDDTIAYCETNNILTVIDLNSAIRQQHDHILCSFTWSPDGRGIAVATFTPDMVDSDGLKFSVLAIWWLDSNEFQKFSDAKEENQSWAVWSLDCKQILFQRHLYIPDKQYLSGWHILDVKNATIQRLETGFPSAEEISRAPRANLVAFRSGPDIYLMDFQGNVQAVGQGRSLIWLVDGVTLLFRDLNGEFQISAGKVAAEIESSAGGQRPSLSLYIGPSYLIK